MTVRPTICQNHFAQCISQLIMTNRELFSRLHISAYLLQKSSKASECCERKIRPPSHTFQRTRAPSDITLKKIILKPDYLGRGVDYPDKYSDRRNHVPPSTITYRGRCFLAAGSAETIGHSKFEGTSDHRNVPVIVNLTVWIIDRHFRDW
jgi:hypothetical protein